LKIQWVAAVLCAATCNSTLYAADSVGSGNDGLQEIIVSARKVEEPLERVPESMTVFTSDMLTALDIRSFNDYATKSANVAFGYGSGSTGISNARTVSIRGIAGQNLFGTAGAVGFYIDDTPVPEAIDPRVIDLDRVEILKGPQGTLYGESSLAGNVRLISKKPDLNRDDLAASANTGLTSGGGSADGGGGVVANLAAVPGILGVRVVLFANHDAGYLTRTFPSPSSSGVGDPFLDVPRTRVGDQGAQTTYGGSINVLLHASDTLETRVRVMFQNMEQHGFAATFAPLPAFSPEYTIDRAFDIQPYAIDRWVLPSLDVTYRTGLVTLQSSTSYFYRRNSDIEDSTYGTQQIFRGYYGVSNLPNQPFLWDQEHRHNQISEELRATFESSLTFTGTIGAFASRTHSTLSIPPTYATGLVAATVGNTVVGPWPNDLIWTDYNPATQDDVSLFGEAQWHFSPRFAATLGARQYWLHQTTDFTANGFNNFGATLSDPQHSHQSGFNPRLGLSYQVTDATMVYASASEGFRAGAAQQYLPFCAAPALPADAITHLRSDSLWSYELGVKSRLPSGVILSAAAFHIDWKDLQQQVALPCGAYFDINGRRARVDGGEFDVAGRLGPYVEIHGSGGIEHTSVTEPGALALVGVTPGSRILGTPQWNASLAIVAHFPLSDSLEGFGELDDSYTGNSQSLLNGGNGFLATRAGYSLANARVGLRYAMTEVSLGIHNVTNAKPNLGDIGYVGYAQYTANGTIIPQVATLQPLTVLLQLRWSL
jgi:outer membrane receptor protein involved in Fe transport